MNADFQSKVEKNPNEFLLVSNTVNIMSFTNLSEKPKITQVEMEKEEKAVDTNDLFPESDLDLEVLKKKYLNNMISWQFLRKIADFHQWPLACIGNFIENSSKPLVETKNIHINMKVYEKSVYKTEKLDNYDNQRSNENSEKSMKNIRIDSENSSIQNIDYKDKIIVLTVKDDGCGISIKKFNKLIYSFSVNPNNEYNFFKYGLSLKASALRLANSFFIISKTENSLSIGLLSKNLQNKYNTEFIITPIINYAISHDKKYTPVSTMPYQTLNLIINEVKFMFFSSEELFNYIDSFEKGNFPIKIGTHIFLYDLKQFSNSPSQINTLPNYELYFDLEKKDIYFNYFKIQIGENHFIDCSLKNYIKFLFLRQPEISIYLMEEKINLVNPIVSLHNVSRNFGEILKISSLKADMPNTNEVFIESENYKGFLFNETFFDNYIRSSVFEKNFEEKEVFNGVLLYQNNRLVSRFEQNKLGDIYFYVNKYQKKYMMDCGKAKVFPVSGYIEVPLYHETLPNKTVYLYNCRSLKIKLCMLISTISST